MAPASKKKAANQRPPRNSVFILNADQLEVSKDKSGIKLNERIDFDDIDDFADEIYAYGKVEEPLKGYRKDGKFYITNGERRWKAVKIIKTKHGVDFPLQFISDSKDVTDIDRLFLQITVNNSGKKFNPVEKAAVISRLLAEGVSEKEIREKLRYSGVYFCNLKKLNDAPQEAKDLIMSNVISATLAMDVFRKVKDFDEAMEMLKNGVAHAKIQGKAKPTLTNVLGAQNKSNSFSAIRKAVKASKKRIVREDKQELFTFLQAVIAGEISLEKLLEDLYEPEQETEQTELQQET